MPPIASHIREQLGQVLDRYGVQSYTVHDIRSGRVNKHWRIEAGDPPEARRYALRRYTHRRTTAAIAYEHDVLRHMATLGWPVAAPLSARDGSSLVTANNTRYSLFPYLPGRRLAWRRIPYYLRTKGTLLAKLHTALATYPNPRPRERIGRHTDLDAWVPATDGRQFDEVLADYAHEEPRLAAEIARWRETSADELDRLGYHKLPETLIHGDFHANNLFFTRRTLTGLLDFDFVRPDKRLADLALTIALEPPAPISLEPNAVATLVAAYHAEAPLSEQEVRLIVPAVRAFYVWLCWWSVLRWLSGEPRSALEPARTLDLRLPNLDANAKDIENALRRVVASGRAN